MEASVSVEGLEAAMKAMQAAFPTDPKKQRQILNAAMGSSARKSMVPIAKQMSLVGDSSGSLSEAIGVRNMSASALRKNGRQAGVYVTPVRSNRKAMLMYIQHYYTSRGITPKAEMITSGIRHGHLVEFGSGPRFQKTTGRYTGIMPARPFLWPAATAGKSGYVRGFSAEMSEKTEAAVRRAARTK